MVWPFLRNAATDSDVLAKALKVEYPLLVAKPVVEDWGDGHQVVTIGEMGLEEMEVE
jgi:hypothetical protein